MSPYLSRVKTASRATTVQVVAKENGMRRIVEHLGFAILFVTYIHYHKCYYYEGKHTNLENLRKQDPCYCGVCNRSFRRSYCKCR